MALRATHIPAGHHQDSVGAPVVFLSRGVTDPSRHWYAIGWGGCLSPQLPRPERWSVFRGDGRLPATWEQGRNYRCEVSSVSHSAVRSESRLIALLIRCALRTRRERGRGRGTDACPLPSAAPGRERCVAGRALDSLGCPLLSRGSDVTGSLTLPCCFYELHASAAFSANHSRSHPRGLSGRFRGTR